MAEYDSDKVGFNTTTPGDGHAPSMQVKSDEFSYCNGRIADIMVAQTGIVATDKPYRYMDDHSVNRSRSLGKMRISRR